MSTEVRSLVFSLVLALLLTGGALVLLWAGGNDPLPALAQGPDGYDVYYVSLDGNCGGEIPCYTTVQAAVDAVDDPADEVWVATGTYTGVQARSGITQMVYISKSLTLRGGYSTTFGVQDPALYTTTLNAQDSGRVLYISGSGITVTVEGLDIYGGYVAEEGGGVYIAQATATITDCLIRRNGYDDWEVYSSKGGGVYVNNGATIRLENNIFYQNWAHYGGGISIENTSDAVVVGNDINSNRARHDPGRGGGVYAEYSPGITLIDNDIHDNQALPDNFSEGGGVYIRYSDHAVLQDNRFYDNYVEVAQPGDITSLGGGGFYVGDSDHVLVTGNEIYSNTVHGEQSRGWPYGGGALIEAGAYITFTHNLVHHNAADGVTNSHGDCGGLALEDVTDSLVAHNEIYANTATDRWGGVVLYGDRFTFVDNQVYDNEAQDGNAGGIFLSGGDNSTLRDNEIHHNTVSGSGSYYYGGGLYVSGSNNNTLEGNHIYANTSAYAGGGIQIGGSGHTLIANRIFSNTASYGGGLRITADDTTLVNNVLAYNEATGAASGNDGSGAAFKDGHTHWYHTTVAGNIGDGSGLYGFSNCTATFTNTLVYSQTTGVRNNGGAVTMTLTLWDDVPTQTVGGVSTFGDITGTAAFDTDGYHLTAASDALDQGVDTDVDADVDGQPRSMGNAPDLGADEYAFYADLALTKTSPGSGNAGEALTYTLTLTNAAASEVDADARVVDTVAPASGVAALSVDAPGDTCTASGAVVTCTVTNINTDTVRTVTVWVTPTATYDGVLTNTATITPTDAVDTDGADNADAVTTTVVYVAPVPDLWVEKEVSAQYAEPGDTLIYTVTWGNNGTGTAYTTTLTDTLPGEVSFGAASPTQNSGPNPLVWDLSDVAPGTSETYVITATVNSGLSDGTELTNHALIAAPTLSDTAVATTTVYALGGYDLAIRKEIIGSGPYDYGTQIHYRITISNTGQLDADVTLNDAIPDGTQYVPGSAQTSGDATGSSLDDSDGITWQGNLDVGDTQVVEFKVEIISAEGVDCGLISNQASASIAGTGYTWLATADANVRSPDLTVDVAPQGHAAKNDHGEFAPYTATVTYENENDHDHPGPAYSTTLTVTLPSANAVFVSSDPKPDTKVNDRTWIWNLGTVNAGANGSINLTIQPDTPGNGEYRLAAKIAGLPEECCDPNAANYDEAWTYRVDMDFQKETQATKWTWATDPQSGQASGRYEQEYYLDFHYQNTNPDRPNLVTYSVTDALPSQLTFDSAVAQPAMDVHQVDDRTMVWRMLSDDPFRVGDRAWIRLKGESGALEAGAVLTNQAHLAYALSAQEQFTNSALVTNTAPLFSPLITYPGNGEICGNEFGRVEVRGQAQPNAKVVIYVDTGSGFYTDTDTIADANGVFTATTFTTLPEQALETIKIYAKACAPNDPGQCSAASNQVEVLESQSNWCPQRSYWEGTVKDGALEGEEMSFRFRDSEGHFSTFSWQMPGVYGFWDTDLHLYSCCNEETQAMTVTADGEVYTPSSRDGHWYHFDITGGAHEVTIQSQCGDEKDESSGEILIDPDGFVFNVDKGGDYDATMGGSFNPVEPISGVTVTCMMSAPEWGGWVPWPAHLYEDQVNPQVTDATYPDGITTTGYYAFFTPPGHYYLQVEGIPGYQEWRSPVVEVITQIVHVNVPYTPWVSDTDVYSVTVMPAPIKVSDGTLWAGVQLDPAVITVPVGSVVEWTSALSKTNTVDDLITWSENPIFQVLSERDSLQDTRGFDSGYLAPGRVYRRAFAYPGVYTYTVLGHSGWVIVTGKQPTIYLPLVLRD